MNTPKLSVRKQKSFSEFAESENRPLQTTFNRKSIYPQKSSQNLDEYTDPLLNFLEVNGIDKVGFVTTKELTDCKKRATKKTLNNLRLNLKKRMSNFVTTKADFLKTLFDDKSDKKNEFMEITKKLYSFYILKNYFNNEEGHTDDDAKLLQEKYDIAEAELNSFLKPLKCKICMSLVPIWTFLDHSNNCSSFYVNNKEILKINQKLITLCSEIGIISGTINYYELVNKQKSRFSEVDNQQQLLDKMITKAKAESMQKSNETKLRRNSDKEKSLDSNSSFEQIKTRKSAAQKSVFSQYQIKKTEEQKNSWENSRDEQSSEYSNEMKSGVNSNLMNHSMSIDKSNLDGMQKDINRKKSAAILSKQSHVLDENESDQENINQSYHNNQNDGAIIDDIKFAEQNENSDLKTKEAIQSSKQKNSVYQKFSNQNNNKKDATGKIDKDKVLTPKNENTKKHSYYSNPEQINLISLNSKKSRNLKISTPIVVIRGFKNQILKSNSFCNAVNGVASILKPKNSQQNYNRQLSICEHMCAKLADSAKECLCIMTKSKDKRVSFDFATDWSTLNGNEQRQNLFVESESNVMNSGCNRSPNKSEFEKSKKSEKIEIMEVDKRENEICDHLRHDFKGLKKSKNEDKMRKNGLVSPLEADLTELHNPKDIPKMKNNELGEKLETTLCKFNNNKSNTISKTKHSNESIIDDSIKPKQKARVEKSVPKNQNQLVLKTSLNQSASKLKKPKIILKKRFSNEEKQEWHLMLLRSEKQRQKVVLKKENCIESNGQKSDKSEIDDNGSFPFFRDSYKNELTKCQSLDFLNLKQTRVILKNRERFETFGADSMEKVVGDHEITSDRFGKAMGNKISSFGKHEEKEEASESKSDDKNEICLNKKIRKFYEFKEEESEESQDECKRTKNKKSVKLHETNDDKYSIKNEIQEMDVFGRIGNQNRTKQLRKQKNQETKEEKTGKVGKAEKQYSMARPRKQKTQGMNDRNANNLEQNDHSNSLIFQKSNEFHFVNSGYIDDLASLADGSGKAVQQKSDECATHKIIRKLKMTPTQNKIQ